MTLMADAYNLATEKISPPRLQKLLGSFELAFSVQAEVAPRDPPTEQNPKPVGRWLTLHSARVFAVSAAGMVKEIGRMAFDRPETLSQGPHRTNGYFEIRLKLQPGELSALEDHRDGGKLGFKFVIYGYSGYLGQPNTRRPESQEVQISVAQSEWAALLDAAGAHSAVFIEIKAPIENRNAPAAHVRSAQIHFANGNYTACVGECRKALEDMESAGAAGILGRLAKHEDRRAMDKPERALVIHAALKNFTHLAAHSPSRGGDEHNRSDAKFLLALTASYAAYHLPGS
jgi:hypothetical protein